MQQGASTTINQANQPTHLHMDPYILPFHPINLINCPCSFLRPTGSLVYRIPLFQPSLGGKGYPFSFGLAEPCS